MRALEVLGLAEDGAHLVCHDPATGEKFTLPSDERLTSAVRGDISRLGQLEIEMESQLRPRDIQARIRAGASVSEVAAAAGTSPGRIERFAYPVLMERSSIAACAATARPVGPAGPAAVAIRDVVADTLSGRGHTGPVEWDAFKDAGGWVLAVSWRAGRSENTALFGFHPGPGGGTVTPRDDAALDLLDLARKPLRTVRPVTQLEIEQTQRIPRVVDEPADAGWAVAVRRQASTPDPAASAQQASAQQASAQQASAQASARQAAAPQTTAQQAAAPQTTAQQAAAPQQAGAAVQVDRSGSVTDDDVQLNSDEQLVADMVQDERAGARPAHTSHEQMVRTGTDYAPARSAKKSTRPAKPAMPSWDDVLLGGGLRQR
jgi:hypothetical protein